MDIVIVTGASRGIGYELLKQLRNAGKTVIGMARTIPNGDRQFKSVDLSRLNLLEDILSTIIEEHIEEATSFTLINNAGTVEPIDLVGELCPDKMATAMSINLTAPMILTNVFIHQLKKFTGPKKIMNISSGAGRNPYEGWGTYCTTKAGLDHFTKVVALEQSKEENPVEVVAIAPGIIDTNMQETIRKSHENAFPLLDQFITYKEQGMLSSPKETAQKLIAFLKKANFKETGPIADIRNY